MANSAYSIVTEFRRKKLCEITSIAPIAHIEFGSGGCSADGIVQTPDSKQTALNEKASSSHTHSASSITQDSSHRFVTDS